MSSQGESHCSGCRLPRFACFCDEIPRVETRVRVVVVRHAAERTRASNTGRVVARAVIGCELVEYGAPDLPLALPDRFDADVRVLYPGSPPSLDLSAIRTLVVLDGSWSQARKMRWRIPAVAALPALSVPAPATAPLRLRRAPDVGKLATIESVSAGLRLLGEENAADQLDAVFRVMALRMRSLRGFDMPEKMRRD